ncbi:MAG TPA: class I SAM-dependent methyltransferase [Blastocatellia bacterium]|nr:class I SAM-dependent methyltransferase [Blastocatellia bacterium]
MNVDGRVIRIVNRSGLPDFQAFLNSATARRFVEQGRLVRTELLHPATADNLFERPTAGELVVEHERVPFQSFPYEWPPEMLHAAGSLTLDLAESLLNDGFGLKDATPYNILFRGPHPVFIDLLSFEKRDPGDPIWLPYAQFMRTFLLPLLVNKHFGTPLDQLLTVRRDGLEPEDVYRLCGPLRRLLPPFLSLASIPTWLAARQSQDDQKIYQRKSLDNPEKARFILETLFKRLRRVLKKVEPGAGRKSAWSDYMGANNNYSDEHFRAKHRVVYDAMAEFTPQRVLDVGCNTGHFSEIAAKRGARVVAIDYDPVVVGETWRRAKAENLDILPLVVNLTRPSPAIGWRNQECPAFLERARGAFDAVLMLAVMHHMLVSERIPLPEIIDLAAELTADLLVIEFIAPADSMFRRITRGRDYLFADLTVGSFEEACRRKFEIVRSQHLEGTSRWLYLLRKR